MAALEHLITLYDADIAARKRVKDAQSALDATTLKQYGQLTESDILDLVLDDKWAAAIRHRILGEVNALTLNLVARIQQLGERYAETIVDLDAQLHKLGLQVTGHLADMGVK